MGIDTFPMCGIAGVIHSPKAAEEIFLGLQNLQHRGQDGGGIVTLEDGCFHEHRGAGLLDIAFPPENFHRLLGHIGIGHTRYATTGKPDPALLQPFVDTSVGLAVSHNGNLVNYHKLKSQIAEKNPSALKTESDSELILHLLAQALKAQEASRLDLFPAIESLSQQIVGSYSVVGLLNNVGLFAFRDPNGLRPLVLGKRTDETGKATYAFASESAALEFLGYTQLENIAAGEAVLITMSNELLRHRYADAMPKHCMFEWVYFSRVESTLDNLPVYQARFNLGAQLATEVTRRGIEPDIVVPVPETSRIAAIALAEQLSVPFREVLIKNRYVNRTFILDSQMARQEAIHRKLYPVASELKDKKVLIVDDSIVRGNTAIKIIELLRKSGAREIYLASTCPPIKLPCYYGIDFPDQDELLAGKYTEDQLASALGVDALIYQSLQGLRQGLKADHLCMACLTGEYPTDISDGKDFAEQRTLDRQQEVPSHV